MGKNEGGVDRIIRIIVGIVLVGLELTGTSPITPWGWIGLIPLVTGLIGWCPAYTIFGIKTSKSENS